MSIGKVIYFHRRKQKLTQEQLCQGICSVTHLSKIENDVNEANSSTLQMLCNKLQINIVEENNKSMVIKQKLDQLLESIERMNQDRATGLYQELLEFKDYVQCTDMLYLYQLYMLRYLLFIDDLASFEKSSKGIHRYIPKCSGYEAYVWEILQAIYLGKKEQYPQALMILSRVEEQAELYHTKITEYHYYRAALHGHLCHYSLSIHYAYKALQVFQNTNNFLRMLYSKMILAVSFIYIGEFDKGKEMLQLILTDAEMLQDSEAKALSLHNLGFLFARQGDSKNALDYYSQALQWKQKDSVSYYITVSYMAETLMEDSQNEKTATMIKEILDLYQGPKSSPHYITLKILYLEATGQEKTMITFLITNGLAIIENMSIERGTKYLEKIIAYYEEKQDYGSANHYLHIKSQYLKNLLINIGSPIDLSRVIEQKDFSKG